MKLMQNLEQFSGVKEEFFDWARHVRSYMTECPDALKLLMLAEKSTESCTLEEIMFNADQIGVDLDHKINNLLISKTKGEAGTIVSQGDGCGSEAWRRLMNRYDPKTAETKRALMKKITIPKLAKNIPDLDKNLIEWEYNIRRYEAASGKPMDHDHKICTIIEMCPHTLKEHLDLNVKEDQAYEEEVRKLITRYVDHHRDRAHNGVMPMDTSGVTRTSTITNTTASMQ